MKEYKKKDGYGYISHCEYGDDVIYYKTIKKRHGYYFYFSTIKKKNWYKGYFNMEKRYGHWMISYDFFKFYYFL